MSSLLTLVTASVLVDLALKSAAVMLLAWAIAALLRRASAAWRHLIWCLSVVSLLLLPALSLALPAWRVTWLPQWDAELTSQPVLQQTAQTVRATADEPLDAQPAAIVSPPSATAATRDAPAASVEPTRGPFPWLTLAWAAGGLLSLAPLAVGLWQLAKLHRGSRVVDDPRWLALLSELRRQLGIRRSVQLRQSEAALIPLTWGALKPVLLVPAGASAWPDSRRRLVLLHELAHVRRWDWLTQLVAHVACGLYWFNPLVWLAARQMRIEREGACDDMVLAAGAKASDYAQELIALVAGLSNAHVSTLVAVPMARRRALEDRLCGILDSRRSRAALTTAVVCLGAAVAAASIAPLAMLQAAPPEPPQSSAEEPESDDPPAADKPAAEKPAQREPTQKEIEARTNGIRISVLNAKGDRGIPEFRVIAGVSSGSVTSEFEKRTGRAVINWQPHTCRIGKEGDYTWPLAKAYDEMALRIEADGYQPQIYTGIKKANGAQHLIFQLAEDKGLTGRVLTPAGKPAAGATVAMAVPHQEIVWEKGKLRGADLPLPEKPGERWRRPLFVTTNAEGVFRLPTEFEPAAVLVVHESGVLEMAYDAWKESPEITLKRWGSIAGQVQWQDKPGADEEVSLTVYRDEYGYPGMVASYAKTRTDKAGSFAFERVLPGLVQISRPIKPAEPSTTGISEVILNGMFQHVQVAAGDATRAVLGGQGRTVTGKFVGLDSWEGATYHFHPAAPPIGFGGDDVSWKAFSQLKASPIGPLLFRDKQPINKDGTFTIEKMLPGRYQLFLSAPGFTRYAASTEFQVAAETPDQKPAAIDLGVIAMVNQPARITTIRGKVVDDATGAPIGQPIIIQAGKFDPADPSKVTWGYSELRSSARDGSFTYTVRWAEGWTGRIVSDGYIPQPVLASAPPADTADIEVTIRLKRGANVRGVVLDHTGKPLKDAAVFAIGPTSLNLAAGHAWSRAPDYGKDESVRPVRTDEQGRFELPTGGAKSLAVSHAEFDAWPVAIPATGDLTIRLPEPARVEVELDIDGADKESVIFYQLLSYLTPEFETLESSRHVKMANPGKLVLAGLTPGKYQFCRRPGRMLDRVFLELKAGEVKAIDYVREKGARVRGKVTWPAGTELASIVVSVLSEKSEKGPFDQHEWTTNYASLAPAEDGTFLTERVPPGTYQLVAYAFKPLTPEQQRRTGAIAPSFQAQVRIEVPAAGELAAGELALKPIVR